MSVLKTVYKQTFIYGLATVVPRMLSFLLVRLHTDKSVLENVADYGDVSIIFAYFVLFNVILAYGMETAFFRFFNKEPSKAKVLSTATISIIASSLGFLGLGLLFQQQIADLTHIHVNYITLVVWTLFLDALVIIPFAYLRAQGKPIKYTAVKLTNVVVNLALNIFLLVYLKALSADNSIWDSIYIANFEVSYIFIANLVASAVTLLILLPFYFKINYKIDTVLWKKMLRYALPVLVSGVAFSVNETFDRVLLERLLPESIAKTSVGMYSACYKLALFMMLFATAYRLGIEPFFFSQSKTKDATKNYAKILEFFVICGALILLIVVVFVDVLKLILIPNEAYWEAMKVVPILLLAYLFLGIYHNLSVWYKITDRTKFGAYISVIGAGITLLVNLMFITSFNYMASAMATLAAYFSMTLLSYYFGRKHYPIPYNIKKISIYLILAISLSALSFYQFRAQYLIGSTLIGILLLIIWQNEKATIKQFLKPSHDH
ncbi:oligosaccharide flippase family protein [Flavobacteriaceae bacterium]|nr:oligosaccharide flippase family protein [Flavobacteriaceae bacterium]MDA7723994.1 oligosaccharide flippase family protein [Flavobacteriaceae bacterium]MDA7728487.1 oligosaccharide flippase family protein [Flavobacteriaceae bacterium]MDB0003918.1 oligosaccharide flippase family protein [Flavobacteriaceae bacterium]MDG1310399.1 oligosaccharide flippase family protein [Flavobacteriaceae bacterium]